MLITRDKERKVLTTDDMFYNTLNQKVIMYSPLFWSLERGAGWRPAKFPFAVASQRGQKLSERRPLLQFCRALAPTMGQRNQAAVGPVSGAFVPMLTAPSHQLTHPHLRSPGQVGLGLSDSSFLRLQPQSMSEPSSLRVQFDPGGRERGAGRHGEGQRVLRRPGDQH